jgi:hypothetical protein
MELELKLSDEPDMMAGWCIDPACLEKIKAVAVLQQQFKIEVTA